MTGDDEDTVAFRRLRRSLGVLTWAVTAALAAWALGMFLAYHVWRQLTEALGG